MRKIFALIFILILILITTLAGCGTKQSTQEELNENPPLSLTDGTYTAFSDATPNYEFGETELQITIKDGKISVAKIKEILDGNKQHSVKNSTNYSYQPALDGQDYFEKKLVGLGTIKEIKQIDDFAGITHSSQKIKQAAIRALQKANQEKSGFYFNGTFRGYSAVTNEHGWAVAYVTINNDVIESAELLEWVPDKENPTQFIVKDYENYKLEKAGPANQYFQKQFVGLTTPEDINEVDNYAGVTQSSQKYKAAVNMALEKAKK